MVKTISFSKVNLNVTKQGDIELQVYKPGYEQINLLLSPDELMMFLVEATNKMYDAKLEVLAQVAERNLQRENLKHAGHVGANT